MRLTWRSWIRPRNGNARARRREVEELARSRHGDRYVDQQQDKAELARVNREIRRLRSELAELEKQRSALSSRLGE